MEHDRSLERNNLAELEAVEQLASVLGSEAFLALAQGLANDYLPCLEEPIQYIGRFHHPSLIGMSDVPFLALEQVCNSLVDREPLLLQRYPYRLRSDRRTALPHALWLQIVAQAQPAA